MPNVWVVTEYPRDAHEGEYECLGVFSSEKKAINHVLEIFKSVHHKYKNDIDLLKDFAARFGEDECPEINDLDGEQLSKWKNIKPLISESLSINGDVIGIVKRNYKMSMHKLV